MPKYSVPDDHWEEDDEQELEPKERPVRVGTHILEVYDEREDAHRYNGIVYQPIIEDGTIMAVALGHYCPGPSSRDPMGFRAWGDVPAPVRRTILDALNAEADDIVDVEATEEVAGR